MVIDNECNQNKKFVIVDRRLLGSKTREMEGNSALHLNWGKKKQATKTSNKKKSEIGANAHHSFIALGQTTWIVQSISTHTRQQLFQ